jgi:hypothetical protein
MFDTLNDSRLLRSLQWLYRIVVNISANIVQEGGREEERFAFLFSKYQVFTRWLVDIEAKKSWLKSQMKVRKYHGKRGKINETNKRKKEEELKNWSLFLKFILLTNSNFSLACFDCLTLIEKKSEKVTKEDLNECWDAQKGEES